MSIPQPQTHEADGIERKPKTEIHLLHVYSYFEDGGMLARPVEK
jgi:hypothetical protein